MYKTYFKPTTETHIYILKTFQQNSGFRNEITAKDSTKNKRREGKEWKNQGHIEYGKI